MPATTQLLIVTADEKLREELRDALRSLGGAAPVSKEASGMSQAVELAANHAPDLALVELTLDMQRLANVVRDLKQASPATSIVAMFRPEELSAEGISESGLLIEALRIGVNDFLRRPISSDELSRLVGRLEPSRPAAPATRGKIVSFVSNKGGVGKSTLALNTAVGLARKHPDRVLLIDASLQMGVAASLLDLTPRTTLTDASRERGRLDETLIRRLAAVHESGLHLLAAPADAVEAMEVDEELIARVLTLAKRTYEFVVIDTFPMFDGVVVAALDMSDRTYVVMENVVPTVQGAAQMLSVMDNLQYPHDRQRLVLNRMTSVAGGLAAEDVATRLERPIDFVLPYDRSVISAANTGQPVILSSGGWWNKFRRGLNELVADAESLADRSISPPSSNGHSASSNGHEASKQSPTDRELH